MTAPIAHRDPSAVTHGPSGEAFLCQTWPNQTFVVRFCEREVDRRRYVEYSKRQEKEEDVIFGGRLASSEYHDMHQVIASALAAARRELGDRNDRSAVLGSQATRLADNYQQNSAGPGS
jgi:hypothetical protein